MNVIDVVQVTKQYRRIPLLSDVTLSVPEGSITGLVGPNGSGKSVLLRLMCKFTEPDSGEVRVASEYLHPGDHFPVGFGVTIDHPGYLAGETGLENLLSLAKIRGIASEEGIREWMKRFGLDPNNRAKMRNYSLGMKQKIALIQTMMEGQRMLILDEPFNALDEQSAATLRTILTDHRRWGGTIVFTSHHRSDIDALADRVLRIDGGRVRGDDG